MAVKINTVKIDKSGVPPVAPPVPVATPVTTTTQTPVKAPTTNPNPAVGAQLGGFLGVSGAQAPKVSMNTGNTETGAANNGFTGVGVDAQGNPIDRSKSLINYGGQQYINYGNGVTDAVNTPEELTVAGQLNNYEANAAALQAQQAAELAQNRSDFDYANNQLDQREAVEKDSAQQFQNRLGGLYSGGLNYQTGGIQRTYGEKRGQLAQDFQRANQALTAKYGSQTGEIRNNINNLLSAAPGLIQQAIDQAAAAKAEAEQKKKQANIDAALKFTNETGYLVNPQDDYSGFYRQVANGAPFTPKTQLEFDKLSETQKSNQLANLWKVADNTGVIPDALADLYGRPHGEQTRAAKQWAAEQGLRADASDRAWITEERLGSQGGGSTKQPETVSTSIAGDYLGNLITEEVEDPDTGEMVKRPIADANAREDAFTDVYNQFYLDTGISAAKLTEVLARAGYTAKEIAQYKKDYPQAFQQASAASGGSASVSVPQEFQSVIDTAQKKYGLGGSNLLAKIAETESSWDPQAHNQGSGAAGLFQFIPSTAKGYGIDPYNVEQAADAAGKLITGLIAKYDGDVSKALAGYNYGGGNVDKLIRTYGNNWLSHAPEETRDYIKKILG